MRITHRFTTRAAASSVVVAAALAFVGVQAAAQTASATPKTPFPACTTANTKLTVTPVTRPINHLLLKATNTGTKPCYAYGAPVLGVGTDAQAAVPWAEETKPQAVVTLDPGKSAYAGIATYSPDGYEGAIAKTLGVFFSNKQMNGSLGAEKTLKLPNGGVYFNSANTVTYWQSNVEDALF
ncbi:DUF4232 domain-containing protein [Streptomyces sp. NPDC001177]